MMYDFNPFLCTKIIQIVRYEYKICDNNAIRAMATPGVWYNFEREGPV